MARSVTHHFRALNHVDESVRVDAAQTHFELHEVGAVEVSVYHLTLLSFVQACAHKACAASVQVIDNERSDIVNLIGDDERGLVALHAVNNQVNDLAFYHNQED